MNHQQVTDFRDRLLRIASDLDQLKEESAIYSDSMALSEDVYNSIRHYDPTALRDYAERCSEYMDEKPSAMKKVVTLHIDDRDERMMRAAELADMWTGGAREHRRIVITECMNDAGVLAAVIGNMLDGDYSRAQALLDFCEDCEITG